MLLMFEDKKYYSTHNPNLVSCEHRYDPTNIPKNDCWRMMEEFLFLDIKALAITTVVRRIIFLKKRFNFPSGTQIFTLLRFGGRSEFWNTGAKNQIKSARLEGNISVTHPCTNCCLQFSPTVLLWALKRSRFSVDGRSPPPGFNSAWPSKSKSQWQMNTDWILVLVISRSSWQ